MKSRDSRGHYGYRYSNDTSEDESESSEEQKKKLKSCKRKSHHHEEGKSSKHKHQKRDCNNGSSEGEEKWVEPNKTSGKRYAEKHISMAVM